MNPVDAIPSYCYGTISKRTDLNTIVDAVKSWGRLPIGWRMTVAESSVHFINSSRSKALKIDIYRTVYTDVFKRGGSCTSEKYVRPNLTDAIQKAKELLSKLADHEFTVETESQATAGKEEAVGSTGISEVGEERREAKEPYWWVCV